MKFCRLLLPMLFVLTFTPLITTPAQTPEPRLREGIRDEARTVLPGTMPPRALRAKDLGSLRASEWVEGMTLVFRRSDAQEAELQKLMAAQQDPASSRFHQWLTPEQFGQRFGMTASDLETTSRWLSGQGFEIKGVSRARDRITFSGTAEQVAAAFSTTLHHFQADGEVHIAPSTVLSLPADLAAITTDVLHLSDFRPHPMAHLSPQPAFTSATTQAHYLSPKDLAVMYDFPANKYPYPGSGQTIAVVGQSYVDLSLDSAVRRFFTSTTTLNLTPVLVPGTGVQAISPGDAAESEIDLEYVAGMLNSANVLLVYVGSNPKYSVFDALSFVIDQNIAPVVSISYGVCEALVSSAELAQGNALFEQAVAQGQTLIAASGDAGSTACAPFPTSTSLTVAQQQALAVDYPADSPYVTAIGGTQMTPSTFAAGASNYWQAATPPFDTAQSLLSYAPETTWNEGSANKGILAGGGGTSDSVARPAWQSRVPGIPNGSTRLLPDIAFQASIASPGFLFCADDSSFVRQYPNCGNISPSSSTYALAGGTSFAAPTFAAMVAVLNQNTQALGQGNVNPTLYRLAGDTTTAASVFHDITSGTIACTSGAPRCSASGQSGFAATAGYDEATGLGSLDLLHLLTAWPAGHAAAQSTVTSLTPYQTAIQPGQTDAINIYVASVYQPTPLTPPTGGVSVAVDGSIVVPNLPFSTASTIDYSGSAAYSYTAPATAGSHVIVVTYPGDSTHGPSSTATAVLVGNVLASGGITLAAGNVTIPANGSGSTTVTVTPSGGYNGRLFWSLSIASSTSSSLTACYLINPLLVQGNTSTTLSLGAGTACSSALPAVQGAQQQPLHSETEPKGANLSLWNLAPVSMALLLCWTFPAAARRSVPRLLSTILIVSGFGLFGCSGSNSSAAPGTGVTPTPPVPQAAIYTATVTGRDSVNGSIASSATFTLTVQ